jgi:hypothetical protein
VTAPAITSNYTPFSTVWGMVQKLRRIRIQNQAPSKKITRRLSHFRFPPKKAKADPPRGSALSERLDFLWRDKDVKQDLVIS